MKPHPQDIILPARRHSSPNRRRHTIARRRAALALVATLAALVVLALWAGM